MRQTLQYLIEDVGMLRSIASHEGVIEKLGPDFTVVIKFTSELASLSPKDFIERWLISSLNARFILEGENYTFGKERKGNINYLHKTNVDYAIETEKFPLLRANREYGDEVIKSGNIRQALELGMIKMATAYLGRNYTLSGRIVQGDKIGRRIGYPTANIDVPPEKIIPPPGVYISRVKIANSKYSGLLYIGNRPSIPQKEGRRERRIEIYIPGFKGNLYNREVKAELLEKVREDIRFGNLQQLKAQIKKDEKELVRRCKSVACQE